MIFQKVLVCFFFNLAIVQIFAIKLRVKKNPFHFANPPYQIEQLRSYKPHLINSFSYPTMVSTLIYFGQVKKSRPLLFYKDQVKSQRITKEIFFVNQKAMTPFNVESYNLQRQTLNINKFMLVVQVENMQIDKEIESKIFLFQRENFYLFIVQYQNHLKIYQLSFIYDSQQIWKISQLQKLGLKIFITNQSTIDTRQTWRLAEDLYWQGKHSVNFNDQNNSFSGIVMELEFKDMQRQKKTQIHLKEIKRKPNQTKQEIIKRVSQNFYYRKLPNIHYPPKQTCAQAAVSKLLSGLTYEYGKLQLRNGSKVLPNQPKQLLSFSPSRTRFPWGFLWDDGFHCEVTARQNPDLTLKVIKSWLDTIEKNGYIPREQNRGEQRENLCNCPRFMAKDINDGNPPALILPLQYLYRNKKLNPESFSVQYWEKVKMWYNWFINTLQTEDMLFKWKDSIRNAASSFTSGMDDFPRPIESKGHVDLQSWIYFFTQFMSEIAPMYGESDEPYLKNIQKIKKQFHRFEDLSDHVLKDFDIFGRFSQHIGYPSILPISLGILARNSSAFIGTMKMIKQQLDTGYGLASISKNDRLYLSDKDAYWRGPVWINMNFLLLRGLHLFYPSQKKFQQKLRANLINTVCENYEESGYFYENYKQGHGSFSYPFNGWTSLISIIVTENY